MERCLLQNLSPRPHWTVTWACPGRLGEETEAGNVRDLCQDMKPNTSSWRQNILVRVHVQEVLNLTTTSSQPAWK